MLTMMRFAVFSVVALLAVAGSSPAAAAITEYDRFQLWNQCQPIELIVANHNQNASRVDLTKASVQTAVRKRLMDARIFSHEAHPLSPTRLSVHSTVSGDAFNIFMGYYKEVFDPASETRHFAQTWYIEFTGTHGSDKDRILSNLTRLADYFVKDYLRVNAEAC